MLEREAMSPAVHVVVALTCALATGCACVRHTQTEPVPTAPPAASIPVAVTPIETAPEAEPTPAVVEASPDVTGGEVHKQTGVDGEWAQHAWAVTILNSSSRIA